MKRMRIHKTNDVKYMIRGQTAYTYFGAYRDYAYFRILVKRGKTPEEALKIIQNTDGGTHDYRTMVTHTKYMMNGLPVRRLLNSKDYGYFIMLIRLHNFTPEEAYKKTMETKNKFPRALKAQRHTKYFYNGIPAKDIFPEHNDRTYFYKKIRDDKMTVEEAVRATQKLIKRRQKIWEDYKAGKNVKRV